MNGCWNWLIRNFLPRQSETSTPVTLDGLPLSMQNSDYWIMNCGKELIASHGDIWSTKTMEMYAALYRLTS